MVQVQWLMTDYITYDKLHNHRPEASAVKVPIKKYVDVPMTKYMRKIPMKERKFWFVHRSSTSSNRAKPMQQLKQLTLPQIFEYRNVQLDMEWYRNESEQWDFARSFRDVVGRRLRLRFMYGHGI